MNNQILQIEQTIEISSWREAEQLTISNTRDNVSSGYPDTEKGVENTTRSGVFLTKFEVFG